MSKKKKLRVIPICGQKVTIEFIDTFEDPLVRGEFNPDKNTIQLLKNDPDRQRHLLHEIIHAVLWYTGNSQKLSEKDEESLVVALEYGLWGLYTL